MQNQERQFNFVLEKKWFNHDVYLCLYTTLTEKDMTDLWKIIKIFHIYGGEEPTII